MSWRLAKSLEVLRSQINEHDAGRSKTSDGTIGNEEHASRTSDHNPWVNGPPGVVTAMDITHDPLGGFDSYKFAEGLRKLKDPRIKYVISNGRIFNSQQSPWQWRKYTGVNKHDHHVHVSVSSDALKYDSPMKWVLPEEAFGQVAEQRPVETPKLALGSGGQFVEELQRILGLEADGHFGPRTEEAVRLFQKVNGLISDGVVGPYTWEKLRKGKSK